MDPYEKISSEIRKEVDGLSQSAGESAMDRPRITDSSSYQAFKKEQREEFSLNSFYEKYCSFCEKIFGFMTFGKETEDRLREEIEIAALNVTPRGVIGSLFFTPIFFLLISIPFLLLGSLSFCFFIVCSGAFLGAICYTFPGYSAEITKIRAQQESILAILYMTIYMRVNPILENAMYFASEHLDGPLGKDLKQCLWLVDNEKVGNLEDAIQYFIPLWVKRNNDFVRSVLILHSVLIQQDKENQARILDKSLDMILSSTYERMKHYSHDLKMPVQLIHTFGLMLPLIGLISFPMISIFMPDSVPMGHLFFGYIVVLPALIFFFTQRIIAKRPGAFSYPDIKDNPYVPPDGMYRWERNGSSRLVPVKMLAIAICLIVILPGLFHMIFNTIPAVNQLQESLNGKKTYAGALPKGIANEYESSSIFMTLTIPVAIGLAVAVFFYFKSIQKLKIRNEVIEIEDDLGGALFQFANQFTERLPIEEAVQNFVNEYTMLNMKKRSIFNFFSSVLDRMQDEGVTFSQAIFQKRYGVIIRYPSVLLKEIAWIITEGARKGSEIVYSIITKISVYLDNTKKIKELIYDLLSDTVAQVNLQAKFMAPFIAALVGSLSLVIMQALYLMSQRLNDIMNSMPGMGGVGDSSTNFFGDLFNFTRMIPPTIFQVLVGIYMVETVYLLSVLASGVENGFDNVNKEHNIGKNMFFAVIVYVMVTVIGTVMLSGLIKNAAGLT